MFPFITKQIQKVFCNTSYRGIGILDNLSKIINLKTKKIGNIIIVLGKTFGHLNQSAFLNEVYSINDGPPPEVNLTNEKNNGLSVLNLIKNNLIESCHDVSSGGILVALAEMSMASMLGLKINKPKKFTDLNEYFFSEDQGRYLLEIEKDNLDKIESMLKKNNIFYEVIAEVQNDLFEIDKSFSIKVNELYNCNNQWFNKFNAFN